MNDKLKTSKSMVVLVFVLADSGVCPECGGSGEYVGLNAVETCGACGGSGEA